MTSPTRSASPPSSRANPSAKISRSVWHSSPHRLSLSSFRLTLSGSAPQKKTINQDFLVTIRPSNVPELIEVAPLPAPLVAGQKLPKLSCVVFKGDGAPFRHTDMQVLLKFNELQIVGTQANDTVEFVDVQLPSKAGSHSASIEVRLPGDAAPELKHEMPLVVVPGPPERMQLETQPRDVDNKKPVLPDLSVRVVRR